MTDALKQSIRNEQYLREERDNLRARLAELEGGNALGRAALNRVTVERDEAKARLAELEEARDAWKRAAELATKRLRELEAAVEHLARVHHDTVTPSKLHNPAWQEWTECNALTCKRAQEALGKGVTK